MILLPGKNILRHSALVFFLLFGLQVSESGASRRFDFQTLSFEQGFPHGTGLSVCQDSYGFIWIATGRGLCRYDGNQLEVYLNNVNDPHSIPENTIACMDEAVIKGKQLLFLGFRASGACVYCFENDIFTVPKAFDPIANFDITDFLIVGQQLWIGTSAGVFVMSDVSQLLNNQGKLIRGLKNKSINDITVDNNGDIWVLTENKVYKAKLQSGGKEIETTGIDFFLLEGIDLSFYPQSICQLEDHLFWIGTEKGIVEYDSKKNLATKKDLTVFGARHYNDIYAREIIKDHDGGIWVGTNSDGLLYFNRNGAPAFEAYTMEKNNNKSLRSNSINSLMIDENNQLWVGTYKGRVSFTRLNKQKFPSFPVLSNGQKHRVLSILPVNEEFLLLGTNPGKLFLANIKTGHTEALDANPVLKNGFFLSLLIDSQNRLWMGTSNDGVYCIPQVQNNPKSIREAFHSQRLPTHYTPESPEYTRMKGWSVRKMYEDKFGNIWAGTHDGGLNKYNEKEDRFEFLNTDTQHHNPLLKRITNIQETRTGWDSTLFISTYSGLVLLKNEKVVEVIDQNDGLKDKIVWSVCQDRNGVFWTATSLSGINKFELLTRDSSLATRPESIHQINMIRDEVTKHERITQSVNYSIIPVKEDELWINTEFGIFCYEQTSRKLFDYSSYKNDKNEEYLLGAYAYYQPSNTLFYGSAEGLTFFNPDSLNQERNFPELFFTELKIMNTDLTVGDTLNSRVVLKKPVLEADEIHLYHPENLFQIKFSTPEFSNSKNISYRYKLEGFNDHWTYATRAQNFASYSNLPKGQYTLRVNASNKYGIWSPKAKVMNIVVHPPWWNTTLARILYGVLILAGGYTLWQIMTMRERYNTRLAFEREMAEKTNELNQLKIKFFMNISHEFRTPLSLILGPTEKMIRDTGLPAKYKVNHVLVYRNANRLLRLVNQLLDMRKLETGTLKPDLKNGDIIHFLKANVESFNDMAERHHMAFTVSFNTSSFYCYFDPDMVEKITQNLLSNAFKFTPDSGKISLKIEVLPDKRKEVILFEITDSGIGIPPEKLTRIFDRFYQASNSKQLEAKLISNQRNPEGTGIGLSLVKELVELLGGTIEAESIPGQSTTFRVKIPVQKTDKKTDTFESEQGLRCGSNEYYELSRDEVETAAKEEHPEKNKKGLPFLLIIDDNPDLRTFLSSSLGENHNIIEADNGKIGINLALKYIPDLIICDVMMPVMDGMAFLRNVKDDIRTSHIPVIMLTAKSSEQHQIAGLGTGADDYITKPFNLTLLEAKVKSLLLNRKKLKHLYINTEGSLETKGDVGTESKFIEKVNEVINNHYRNPDFEINLLAKELAMSSSLLYMKLNLVSEKSFMELVREKRIREAIKLIKQGTIRVKELAYMVGFSSPEYFAKSFKKVMEMTPRDFMKSLR